MTVSRAYKIQKCAYPINLALCIRDRLSTISNVILFLSLTKHCHTRTSTLAPTARLPPLLPQADGVQAGQRGQCAKGFPEGHRCPLHRDAECLERPRTLGGIRGRTRQSQRGKYVRTMCAFSYSSMTISICFPGAETARAHERDSLLWVR